MTSARFGPQTPQVEALLKRSAALTQDEVAALCEAREAVRIDAWGAAWDDARFCERDAAIDAAIAAARVAAAIDAAVALVVRDLISPEDFNTLTGPWVSVIGPTWDEVDG